MKNQSLSIKQKLLSRWTALFGLGTAVCAAIAIGCMKGAPARAETPAAAAAGDTKAFTQSIPGSDLKFDMVPIPAGKFKMGSPETEKKRKDDEGPEFEVSIEPFFMGKYEVTWDLYEEFLRNYNLLGKKGGFVSPPIEKLADAVSYPTPIYDLAAGPALQRMGGRESDLPAVIMSHFAAKQFTKWLSAKTGRFYRLPTEAEWEYAARAGTTTAYFFGDDPAQLGDYAWFEKNSNLKDGDPGYHPVGKKKPNPWGLYDIYGNVAEIVIDQYDPEQYKSLGGKSVTWRDAIRWPNKQYPRIVRGGGYESDPDACRSASRLRVSVAKNEQDPQNPKSPYWWTEGFSIGFRLVSPVKEPTDEEKHKFWDVDSEAVKDILGRDREIRQNIIELAPKKDK